jgi:hypothetical protein
MIAPLLRRAALLAVLVPAAAAPAAIASPQEVSLAPTQLDVGVRVGRTLAPLTVHNDGNRPLTADAAFFLASADLSGMPVYGSGARARAAGARVVEILPRRQVVPAHGSAVFRARVVGRPAGAVGVAGVLTVTAERTGLGASSAAATVTSRLRLSSTVLLRFDGPRRRTLSVTDLAVQQVATRRIAAVVTLANRGNVDLRAAGTLALRDEAGHRRRLPLESVRVLPGSPRAIEVALPRLPAGRFTLDASLRAGGLRARGHARLALSGPGTLVTPRLRLASAAGRLEGGRAFARLTVANAGDAVSRNATVQFTMPGAQGAAAQRRVRLGPVTVARRRSVEIDLGRQLSGAQIAVRVFEHGALHDEGTITLHTPVERSTWSRVRDWAAGHVGLMLAIGGLLVAGLLTSLVLTFAALRRASA